MSVASCLLDQDDELVQDMNDISQGRILLLNDYRSQSVSSAFRMGVASTIRGSRQRR